MTSTNETKALLDSLSKASLLPSSLIPQNFAPSVQLFITFNNKQVDAGNLFRASECKDVPRVTFTPEATVPTNTKYTLLLVDPDAPTPADPQFAYWRHWVVSSISSHCVSTGKILTAYLGPGPKDESAPHRYMFLLYREPFGMKELSKADVGGEEFVERRSFAAKEWVDKHDVELVGVQWMLGAGDGWKE